MSALVWMRAWLHSITSTLSFTPVSDFLATHDNHTLYHAFKCNIKPWCGLK